VFVWFSENLAKIDTTNREEAAQDMGVYIQRRIRSRQQAMGGGICGRVDLAELR